MEKIDPNWPRKNRREREKRVRLAEHLVAEEPIQRWRSVDKCSLYMCTKFSFSDAKDSDYYDRCLNFVQFYSEYPL